MERKKRSAWRGQRRETAAERAYTNRWYTLAETYEVLTVLALPPEPVPRPFPPATRARARGGAAARRG